MISIMGYADRMAARPGETLAFKISCTAATYEAAIVRLRCGDDRPDGPGFSERVVEGTPATYPGRVQPIPCGSCIIVPASPVFAGLRAVSALIWPTLPAAGAQTILSHGEQSGLLLYLDEAGRLALRLGDATRNWTLALKRPMEARRWARVLASFDPDTGMATLHQNPLDRRWGDTGAETRTERCDTAPVFLDGSPFLMGAHLQGGARAGHFNGKLEAPRCFSRCVTPEDHAAAVDQDVIAAWDFSREIPTRRVIDLGPHGLHGECVNLPARAVTGSTWTGDSLLWTERPGEYAAIHLHEDDLYDCLWETDFAWTIPPDLASGIYAARLRADGGEDHVPFFVLAPRGKPGARVAFLAATATYLAYANSHDAYEDKVGEVTHGALPVLNATDRYLATHRELGISTYDLHRDGSGGLFSSRLRPILNARPRQALWSFNADLHVADWLDAMGEAWDVVDDETLHDEGTALLDQYACIVTGTHPEYFSRKMLDGVRGFLAAGGRLMYLGGNGFYWCIDWHPAWPGAIEVRRGSNGTRCWTGRPGEDVMSSSGQFGGLWRNSGRPPESLAGVGFIAQGFDSASPYHRRPESHDPRAAFIFEGVTDEVIGDFGAFGGAAALELDIMGPESPRHALRLASSRDHTNLYLLTPEALEANIPNADGIECERVRADMVFFETPSGGAVFAVGSIGWASSLAHDGYANNVSRITANVLRRFVAAAPFASS